MINLPTMSRLSAALLLSLNAMGLAAAPDVPASTKAVDVPSSSAPQYVQFDLKMLSQRGFPADVADFFARGPRFLPGTQPVWISINGAKARRVEARFGSEGELCFDSTLAASLSLRIESDAKPGSCPELVAYHPEARVGLRPGASRVDIVVPEDALSKERSDGWERTGAAAILNYEIFARSSQRNGMASESIYARLEPGINWSNWVARSRASYYQYGGEGHFARQEIYASRAIEPWKSKLEVGQIQVMGQSFGGTTLLGAQVFSDNSQRVEGKLVTPIQGVARTQALVEVRQRGQLVYKTLVSPGPFVLEDVAGLSPGADVDVEVIEQDGSRQRFSVAGMQGFVNPDQGGAFSISAGIYREPGALRGYAKEKVPVVATIEYAHSPLSKLRLVHAGLAAKDYASLSHQASVSLDNASWLNGGIRLADSNMGSGAELAFNGGWQFADTWSASFAALHRTRDFLDVAQAFNRDFEGRASAVKTSYGISTTYAATGNGTYSYGFNRSVQQDGERYDSHYLGYSHRFRSLSVNAGVRFDRGTSFSDRLLSLSLSIPLGGGSLSTRSYQNRLGSGHQALYQARISSNTSYQVEATASHDEQQISGSISTRTAYSQVRAGASISSDGLRSINASASGSIVWDGDILAASSRRMDDTFAIVTVPGVSGLRLQTTGGKVITDWRGVAVVPAIYAYSNSRIDVDGLSIPKNYRLKTTVTELALAYGSVAKIDIPATQVRQVLLRIALPDGNPARMGSAIKDEEGNLVSTVIGEGNVLLINGDIEKRLTLIGANQFSCGVAFQIPRKFDPDKDYEEVDATCS